MNEDLLYLIRGMLLTVLAMVFLYLLTDSRFDKTRTDRIAAISTSALITANIILFSLMGRQQYDRLMPLLLHLPAFVPFVCLARHRGFRLVFTLFTSATAIFMVSLAGVLCSVPFGRSFGADAAGRIGVSCLFLFLFWRLRPLYFYMQEVLRRGWGIFCLIPFTYYLSTYFLIIRAPPDGRSSRLPYYLSISIAVILTYAVIFYFSRQAKQYDEHKHEHKLLKVQLAAYQQQSEILFERERRLTALRHDMRHYIHTLTALLQEGDIEHALAMTNEYDESLLNLQGRRWCDNKAVGAMLSYYLGQAEQNGIQIAAALDLPDMPESTELSIVFANMVENALHACCKQPQGEDRRMVLHAVSTPQLVIEVANTYSGKVHFGQDGLPLSAEEGHGIGTKNICDFAKRQGAACTFTVKDGMFRVRLLIPPKEGK